MCGDRINVLIKKIAKLESELSELEDEEKNLYLQEVGITNSGLDKLIYQTYNLQ